MIDKIYNRRGFIKTATGGGLSSAFPDANVSSQNVSQSRKSNSSKIIRLGFIGVGGRGQYHLSSALGIEGVEVPAICEVKPERLYTAKRWIEESGRPTPTLYSGPEDYVRLCEKEDLDAVIICTPWQLHAPACLAAQRSNKHAVSEVPMLLTVDEAWEILETYEKTGHWATIGLEGFGQLALLNMIQKGMLGDIVHAESGYVHDLRLVKYDPEEEPWRLQHSIERNGNLYPDHPMNRMIPALDINHGDRIDYLMSMSSKAVMLNDYAAINYGKNSPYAKMEMKLGDYNSTLIRTVNGKMITLNHDTNTPHPREHFRIQGTKGVFFSMGGESQIYIEGVSPKEHEWEPANKYLEDNQHPIIKNYNPPARIWGGTRGHGGQSSQTPIVWHRLIEALRENRMPDWDIYDSLTSSTISPITEDSVAMNGQPVKFPDFTKGKWKERSRLTFS
jgi:predicted dehydrogenase